MTGIAFRRIDEHEALIVADGETVGGLYRQTDLIGGGTVHVAHLDEDPRGFRRIFERAHIRDVVAEMLETHPLR